MSPSGRLSHPTPCAGRPVDVPQCSTAMSRTILDADRALAEIHRVLRPGGELHFVEHGRSPVPAVSRWQDRLTPLQRRLFGGCHLNRPIDELVTRTGFQIARMQNYYLRGPKAVGYMFEGVATTP